MNQDNISIFILNPGSDLFNLRTSHSPRGAVRRRLGAKAMLVPHGGHVRLALASRALGSAILASSIGTDCDFVLRTATMMARIDTSLRLSA